MVLHALQALDGLKAGKCKARETKPVLPVADDVIDATVKHCRKTLAAMIRFQRYTGCRPGEVCSLKPKEIDRTGDVWLYRPSEHKSDLSEFMNLYASQMQPSAAQNDLTQTNTTTPSEAELSYEVPSGPMVEPHQRRRVSKH